VLAFRLLTRLRGRETRARAEINRGVPRLNGENLLGKSKEIQIPKQGRPDPEGYIPCPEGERDVNYNVGRV
jgi:hypothetical protein